MGYRDQRFNKETLQFEAKSSTLLSFLKKGGIVLGLSLVLGIIFSFTFLQWNKNPQITELENRNQELLLQYQSLNSKLATIETALDKIQQNDDNIYRTMLNSEPIPESVRKAGFGGVDLYKDLESLDEEQLVATTAKRIDILSKQTYIQGKSYLDVYQKALNKEKELASIPAIRPLSPKENYWISSGYGYRNDPITKVRTMHNGMDFVAKSGTDVHVTGDGVVKRVRSQKFGHGKHVVVDHGYGYITYYSHLSGFNVKVGQKVKRGDVVGYLGNTGKSTGPHLHYEVRKDNRSVNPVNYFFKDLNAEEYQEMLIASSSMGRSLD